MKNFNHIINDSNLNKSQKLSEIKKLYKQLALSNHPDRGGDLEIMKAINNDYDNAFNTIMKMKDSNPNDDSAKKREYKTSETPKEFREIIEKLMGLDGIVIEITGNWIWISGDTMKHKKYLKSLDNVSWAPVKKLWYWRMDEWASKSRKSTPMDQIRNKFGSDVIYTSKQLEA